MWMPTLLILEKTDARRRVRVSHKVRRIVNWECLLERKSAVNRAG